QLWQVAGAADRTGREAVAVRAEGGGGAGARGPRDLRSTGGFCGDDERPAVDRGKPTRGGGDPRSRREFLGRDVQLEDRAAGAPSSSKGGSSCNESAFAGPGNGH